MSYRIPEGSRSGEWRINYEYKVIWWQLAASDVDPELWYWKLLKGDEPVNGGMTPSVERCKSEANWAFNRIIEGTFCAVEGFDERLGRTVTRLRRPDVP